MHSSADRDRAVPIAVDLDGTLIRSDLLVESLCVLLKTKPLLALLVPFWLYRGKAYVKAMIARHTSLSPRRLPVSPELEAFLAKQPAGRKKVLATASNEKFARQVASHFGFDEVIASDATTNMSGTTKRDALVARYGEGGFDYAGDASVDIPVWKAARKAILVNAEPRHERRLARAVSFDTVLDRTAKSRLHYLKAMRIYQWVKNLLIFVPLLVAHKFHEPLLAVQSLMAFFAFCLCASSVYVLNDLFDLPDDRLHPSKKLRPIAHGDIPIGHALVLIPLLLLGAAILALMLPPLLGLTLLAYYGLTLLYSISLKSIAVLDVQILASFYTLRLIAGAAVIEVVPSFWLLAFSMSLFLSLALAKRYTGLLVRKRAGQKPASRRGYTLDDMPLLQSLGVASGYISVLILALYVNSAEIGKFYQDPMWLWLLCPAVLYWIGRVWIYAHRGKLHDDPLIFAITDRISLGIGAIMVLITLLAI
ncbi:UbiA family prenyltransferase [Granulosicoccaceae sp. 1_MG-2023]|nr:UbiA family prenyltransferase [Granulosicoccaceae sp. 1_MG-2023]